MAYFLGIDVGAARTVAAVARPGHGDVETVDLGEHDDDGGRLEGIASVLHLGADGVLAVGAAAQERLAHDPDRVAHGFPGRIGDDAMLLAGEPWAPEELTAWLVRWVVDRVTEREGGPAAAVAVSHPAPWDADRTRLLADAVAEQELDVAFVASAADGGAAVGDSGVPGGTPGSAPGGDDGDDGGVGAARQAARALRAAAVASTPGSVDGAGSGRHPAVDGPGSGRHPAVDGPGSGRHLVVGGAIAALASVSAATTGDRRRPTTRRPRPGDRRPETDDRETDDRETDDRETDEREAGDGDPAGRTTSGRTTSDRDETGDPAGPVAVDPTADGPDGGQGGPAEGAAPADDRDGDRPSDDAASGGAWDVPAPRSPEPGAHPADPATTNLVADLVGFTGGMGATNTAGLLSGFTPPHGSPALWSGGEAAAPGTTTTATGGAVALPTQRSGSGRWAAVASEVEDAPDVDATPTSAPRARTNPTVLIGAGGLAAAAAVVATLFLWPAPRTTDSAVRPVAAVPATTAAQPTAPTAPLTPTAEPVSTHRSRPPAPPRTRRPAAPPVTASGSATDTTPPPTASTEPTESPTSAPPSSEPTEPTTTKPHDD